MVVRRRVAGRAVRAIAILPSRRQDHSRSPASGCPCSVAAFATVVVVDTVSAARAGTPEPIASASMAKLGDAAFAALPARPGVVELRVRGHEGAYWASAGVADVLEHHGADVRVGPELEFAYGPQRLVGDDPVRSVVLVADKAELANVRALPGYREVARDGGVSVFVGPP